MKNSSDRDALPGAFAVLLAKPLHDYLKNELPEDLDAALTLLEGSYITNNVKENQIQTFYSAFERRCAEDKQSILHQLVYSEMDWAAPLLKRILSLGIDVDLADSEGDKLTHICSYTDNAYSKIAKLLVMCRPDLEATNKSARTALVEAETAKLRKESFHGAVPGTVRIVAAIWRNAAQGFPTIAKLVYQKEFWAVQNVVRRGIVPDEEKFDKFRGKTAYEWAIFYGKAELAKELEYYLLGGQRAEAPSGAEETDPEGLKEMLAVTVSNLTGENETVAREVGSLKEQLAAAKEDISRLEEKLRENQKKSKEDLASFKRSLRGESEKREEKLMVEMQSMQREWTKQQELLQSQIKTLQDQQAILPSVISSTISAAAAAFQPAGKRFKSSQQ